MSKEQEEQERDEFLKRLKERILQEVEEVLTPRKETWLEKLQRWLSGDQKK
jgi:hypothetical protein